VGVGTDVAACLPTVAHSQGFPYSGAWSCYARYGVRAAAAMVAAGPPTLTAVGYPASLETADTAIAAVILSRRRARRSRKSPSSQEA
jgi:hypothetical protein